MADTDRRLQRAVMVIHHKEHTVVDRVTNERFKLPAAAAWEKYDEINRKGLENG